MLGRSGEQWDPTGACWPVSLMSPMAEQGAHQQQLAPRASSTTCTPDSTRARTPSGEVSNVLVSSTGSVRSAASALPVVHSARRSDLAWSAKRGSSRLAGKTPACGEALLVPASSEFWVMLKQCALVPISLAGAVSGAGIPRHRPQARGALSVAPGGRQVRWRGLARCARALRVRAALRSPG